MANIHHQVLISASKSAIYYAITQQKGLSKWWMADSMAKPEIGFINEFKVGDSTHHEMKITKLEENKLVEWECINNNEWNGTIIRFELSDKRNFTCVDFYHNGYKTDNGFYATCNFHWARHLIMLKKICETGDNQLDQKVEQRFIDEANS